MRHCPGRGARKPSRGGVFAGIAIAGVLGACAQWIGIEDLPPICGEPIASNGVPAGDDCPGELLGTFPIAARSGEKYGELKIYYDASTARNCARAEALGSVAGQASGITVNLARCSETAGAPDCTREVTLSDPSEEHPGSYRSYAGPISIDAMDQCIYASASLLYDGQCARASTGGAVFCD